MCVSVCVLIRLFCVSGEANLGNNQAKCMRSIGSCGKSGKGPAPSIEVKIIVKLLHSAVALGLSSAAS